MVKAPWYLAIDFGTSRTAAAVVVGDGEPDLVRFEERPWMPSAVFVKSDGDYRTGAEAMAALGGERPEQVILTPKLRMAEGRDTLDVGFGTIPTYKLVAEVLRTAYRGACGQVRAGENGLGSHPDAVTLTCPVGWTAEAKKALRAAADHAGMRTTPKLSSEPEAAAGHFQAHLSEGDVAAVYDLGGGTCDIAVVRREGDGFRTLAKEYSDLIGGELFDDSLYYRHVLAQLGELHGQAKERLELVYHDPTSRHLKARQQWRACERQLRRNVSEAKERLSASTRQGVHVPRPVGADVAVSRQDFEELIRRDVDRTVALLRKCVDRALDDGDELKVVYLVGGSSLIPLAQERVRKALRGTQVEVPSETLAKAPVALGAVTALARSERRGRERARERSLSPERAARNQANVTQLVQDPDWDATPEPVRARLLDAVLTSPEDEEIADLIAGADLLERRQWANKHEIVRTPIALLITSARVLWAGTATGGQPVSGQVRFADATDVGPISSSEEGLCGLCVRVVEKWACFDLTDLDEATLLDWVAYVGDRLPSGAPRDGGALLAKLRQLREENAYKSGSRSAAWLATAVAQSAASEEIVWLESCHNDGICLLTTSERLVWTRGDACFERPLAGITSIEGLSSADNGLYGFRIFVGSDQQDFHIWRADRNIAYMYGRLGLTPAQWLINVARLHEFPDWSKAEVDARDWIEHAVVGAADEQLLQFAHCSYVSEGIWGGDWTKTTALLLTTKRVLWARFGVIAGLTTGEASLARITKVGVMPDGGLALRIGGTRHGFVGFPADDMLRELRSRCRLTGSS